MTDLSPAAQAMMKAYWMANTSIPDIYTKAQFRTAAALEALAEQLGYELLGVRVVDCSQILIIAAELRQ